ncbi:MAG: hypothetical protein L0G69_01945, partial [Brevibacterium sp.]|nr:hypothetical protein [Brevibacterium sp.]
MSVAFALGLLNRRCCGDLSGSTKRRPKHTSAAISDAKLRQQFPNVTALGQPGHGGITLTVLTRA